MKYNSSIFLQLGVVRRLGPSGLHRCGTQLVTAVAVVDIIESAGRRVFLLKYMGHIYLVAQIGNIL